MARQLQPLTARMESLCSPSAPSLDRVGYAGKIGDKIVVRASDELEVSAVAVAIRDNGATVRAPYQVGGQAKSLSKTKLVVGQKR